MSWKLDKLLNDVDPQDVLSFDPVVATMQNGDLVLCELAEIDEDNYCMMTPFRLIDMESEDGELCMQAVRFIPGSDDIFFHVAANQVVTAGAMTDAMFSFFTSAVDRMLESMSASTGDADESTSKSNVLAFQPKGTILH